MRVSALELWRCNEGVHGEKKSIFLNIFFTFFYLFYLNTEGNHLSLVNNNAILFIGLQDYCWFEEAFHFYFQIYLNPQKQLKKTSVPKCSLYHASIQLSLSFVAKRF